MGFLSCIKCETQRFESEAEVVAFFCQHFSDWGIERLETLLGIEFAFKDGSYHSEAPEELEGEDLAHWESQDVNFSRWRHADFIDEDEPGLPEHYPALLVFSQIGHDGGGEVLSCAWVTQQDLA